MKTEVDIPEPLLQQQALNVAVYYPEATRSHSFIEDSDERSNWSIATGQSQVELFNKIIASMFTSTTYIENLDDTNSEYDMLIVPQIKDIQFALPHETGLRLYEAWIDYELSFQAFNGDEITTLKFTGYGSSDEGFFRGSREGLLEASNEAFRELGAQAIVRFSQSSDIQKWLLSQQKTKMVN